MAQGDYEVVNGFALVAPEDPEVWGLGEPFGMYLPEYAGMYGLDGCGGRCPEPSVFTGSERYGIESEQEKHMRDVDDRFFTMDGLGDGLVQMIEGLSEFGDLGYTEYLAYGDLNDLREGYPLGQVDIGPQDEYEFGAQGGGYDPAAYEDDYPAPPPDMTDVPQANTPDQAELADILEQRRQAIADAIKQRNLQTQKVTDLDHQIVEVLNPQYQQALAANDQEAAVKLGGQIRILNLQRAEAVQKALDWASFQATAAQMAKNVKAQLALNQLYQEVLVRQDPQAASEIQRAYWEIGQATAAIKQARANQLAQQQAASQQQQAQLQASAQQAEISKAQQKVTTLQTRLQTLQTQYTAVVKEVAALKSKPGMKIIPKAKTDAMQKLALLVTSAKNALAKAKQEMATKQAQIPLSMQQQMQPYAQQGYDPYADQGYGYEEFQGLDGLDALDASVPFCTLYTRDGYGPTCMQAMRMNLGDLGFDWDMFTRVSTDVVTGGAAELAWNEKARSGLDQKVDKVGKVAGFIGKNVTCPVAKNLQITTAKGKPTSGSIAAAFATSALVGLCDTKGSAPLKMPVIVSTYTPVYKRWWFVPLCIAVGGVGYGVYRGLRAPRSLQGFGRVGRRRRHRR